METRRQNRLQLNAHEEEKLVFRVIGGCDDYIHDLVSQSIDREESTFCLSSVKDEQLI